MRSFLLTTALALIAYAPAAAEDGPRHAGAHRGELRERLTARFDANKDGKLDEAERAAAKAAFAEHRGEHRGKIFDRIDANDDGSISRDEFMSFQGRHHGHRDGSGPGARTR